MGWNLDSKEARREAAEMFSQAIDLVGVRHWTIAQEFVCPTTLDVNVLANVHTRSDLRKAHVRIAKSCFDEHDLLETITHELVHVLLVDRCIRLPDVLTSTEIESLTVGITNALLETRRTGHNERIKSRRKN